MFIWRTRVREKEENRGAGTGPDLYEGLLMGLKEPGLTQFYGVKANRQQTCLSTSRSTTMR